MSSAHKRQGLDLATSAAAAVVAVAGPACLLCFCLLCFCLLRFMPFWLCDGLHLAELLSVRVLCLKVVRVMRVMHVMRVMSMRVLVLMGMFAFVMLAQTLVFVRMNVFRLSRRQDGLRRHLASTPQ